MTANPYPHSTPIPESLGAEGARRMYRAMLLTRLMEERLWIMTRQGKAHFVLTARGHEAAQIGTAFALRAGHDYVWTYYRSLGVALALGLPPRDMFLSVLGKAEDPLSGGRQLPNHFSSKELRMPTVSSSVASQIPHAVGSAWAARVLNDDTVSACYFGDGATSKGEFHEGVNIAGVRKLPVIFVCENNRLSISVPFELQMATKTVAERAAAYGMPGILVDGLDPFAVYNAMQQAVDRARNGDGPTLIEATCVRLTPHSSDDDDRYRSDEEKAANVVLDPLFPFRDRLIQLGVLTLAESEAWTGEIRESILADQDWAETRANPDPARSRRWLYAES